MRYHVDALAELGLVGVASERVSARGPSERFYRAEEACSFPTEQAQALDKDQARPNLFSVVRASSPTPARRSERRRSPRVSSRQWAGFLGEVDRQGWEELTRILDRALGESQAVIAQSKTA